jgi:hypothetical protein
LAIIQIVNPIEEGFRITSPVPQVWVPIYAPWRMYYPYNMVFRNPIPQMYNPYMQTDQYNIYQNIVPYYN